MSQKMGFDEQYNALYIFAHFLAALCKTTTLNDQIQSFIENLTTVNFPLISIWTCTLFLRIQVLDSSTKKKIKEREFI